MLPREENIGNMLPNQPATDAADGILQNKYLQQTNEDVLLEDPVSEFAQWRLTAERASLSIPSRAVPLRIFMRHILI